MSMIPAPWVAILFLLIGVNGEDTCTTTTDTNFTLSSLQPDELTSVEIWVEVSAEDETYVVKESYDPVDEVYQLEYYDDERALIEHLHVDREKNITLLYNDAGCTVVNNSKDVYRHIPFMKHLRIHDLPKKLDDGPAFIGPASIIENFINYDRREATGWRYGHMESCMLDRGIPCELYRQCDEYGNKYDFYFSPEGYSLYGRNESQPLRVTVVESTNVEVLNIKASRKSLDLFIPTGLQCKLPVPVEKTFPKAEKLELEAELVIRARQLNQTYVSQFSLIYRPSFSHPTDTRSPGLYSFSYSTWKMNDDLGLSWVADNHVREIYDADHYLVYMHTDKSESTDSTTCAKFGIEKEFEPKLPLIPMLGQISLKDLFLERPEFNDRRVAYLGKNKVRGVDAEVYEVTYKNYQTSHLTLSELVISHFLDNDIPLAVEMNGFDKDGKVFNVLLHVSESNGNPVELNEKFRIDDCYSTDTDKSVYNWFQVGFQLVNPDDFAYLLGARHKIKEEFLTKLYTDYHFQPMRVPYVSVDFVEAQVRINTLLLEAPLIADQFDPFVGVDIRDPSKQLGVLTKEQCLRSCLAMRPRDCTAISYCGSTCVVSKAAAPTAKNNTITEFGCTIYERRGHQTNDHTGYPVSSSLLLDIRAAAEAKDEGSMLKLEFDVKTETGDHKPMLLKADTYDDTKDFESAFHHDKDKVPTLEIAFQIAASKKRYNPGKNGPTKLGAFPIEDCATACHNRGDCESFSYCANSGECVISMSHAVQEKQTTPDTHCVIYQTKYLDRFDKFDGLTIKGKGKYVDASSADTCAQKCVEDATCKSFDFCGSNNECMVYKTHITDVSKGDVNSQTECAHYSKRYLYDYTKKLDTQGNDGVVLGEIYEETQAACAKRCTEWSNSTSVCLSFDFCKADSSDDESTDGTRRCRLRTTSSKGKRVHSSSCDFFYYTSTRKTTKHEGGHGAGAAFGMSVIMIFVGIGLGVGAVIGYNRFTG